MELSKLSLNQPIGEEKVTSTDFIDVSNYKFLRIAYFSNAKCTLQLCWSLSGITSCITTNINVVPLTWRSHKSDIVMNYLKIVVIIAENEISENLIVNVSGREYPKIENSHRVLPTTPEPLAEKLSDDELISISRSCSSPLKKRAFFNLNSKRKSSLEPPNKDSRLPDLLLNGQIFYAKDRKIIGLPIGNKGDVLSVSDNGCLEWVEK
jgi:hypothetical protein